MEKPHAVCIPYPAQGHINPMLKLGKLLHVRGFHITFVNTEYNHKRLLKSRGPNLLNGVSSFSFVAIPDGLPEPDGDATQDISSLCESTKRTCLTPFRNLFFKLNNCLDVPPVTCIVSDGAMSFTLDAAKELGIPEVLFWTTSACGFMCYMQYRRLVQLGFTPLKESSYMTNGYLDTSIDWVPGIKEIQLKDVPSFIRTTNPQEFMMDFIQGECERAQKASAIIVNTFDALEHNVLDAFSSILLPPIYSIGPLNLLLNNAVTNEDLKTIGSNLWKEESQCLEWLNSKEPNSVIYVNFGSITVMTSDQLVELAWGLANSNKTFLWVIRPDLVAGENSILPLEFLKETRNRGMLLSWCPQEVLGHHAVGGFLTHCGWNSTLESVCEGVPMLCWPFFAEQQTNCRFCCKEWGVGLEIDDVKREKIEGLVRELMERQKGQKMKARALEWKKLAKYAASSPHGSSFVNMDNMVGHVLKGKIAKN
ncbi:7-deoxyloganetin glucosyltransferase-like isoform X2 [Abrus precatorius]|uniref:7-deoxyloganetin glucosyltransferase-like isoform X2 n=1 Tax=Abrus precatorius TaxID=3816 RepID=A0A8B8LJR0_ABRPR|nr:7-deoxyloganetin glucosyltransferase-like isoform X2 [Abrus precatorius]